MTTRIVPPLPRNPGVTVRMRPEAQAAKAVEAAVHVVTINQKQPRDCPHFNSSGIASSDSDGVDMPVWSGFWLIQWDVTPCPGDEAVPLTYEVIDASAAYTWTLEPSGSRAVLLRATANSGGVGDPRWPWWYVSAFLNGSTIGPLVSSIEDHSSTWKAWSLPDGTMYSADSSPFTPTTLSINDATTAFYNGSGLYFGRDYVASATQLTGTPEDQCLLTKVGPGQYIANISNSSGAPGAMAGTAFQIDHTVCGRPYGDPIILTADA